MSVMLEVMPKIPAFEYERIKFGVGTQNVCI